MCSGRGHKLAFTKRTFSVLCNESDFKNDRGLWSQSIWRDEVQDSIRSSCFEAEGDGTSD